MFLFIGLILINQWVVEKNDFQDKNLKRNTEASFSHFKNKLR